MNEEWLTTSEAAALSGYDVQHVRRLLRQGHVHGRKFGPVWMVDRASLVAYQSSNIAFPPEKRRPRKS